MGIFRKLKKILLATGIAGSLLGVILFVTVISTMMAALSGGAEKSYALDEASLSGLPPCLTEEIIRAAVKSYERYGVPTAITLSQIIVESGTEFSALAKKDKNLFGVKFYGSGVAGRDYNWYKTTEYGSGGSYEVWAKFAKYESYEESIDEHGALLSRPLYKDRVTDLSSSDSWANALQGVYATAPNYAGMLKSIMRQYDLYRFDGVTTEGLKDIFNASFNGAAVSGNDTQKRIARIASSYNDPFNNGFTHLCEAWVADAYQTAGLNYIGSCCAAKSRDTFAKKSGKIPVGAAIYSGSSYRSSVTCECGRNAGHIAIYIGNNKVAGSQVPYIMDLNEWISIFGYGGWSFNDNEVI